MNIRNIFVAILTIAMMLITTTSLFVEQTQATSSASFSEKADYNTNFDSKNNDNCLVSLNGWTETFIDSWDGTKAAYFNEGYTSTNKAVITMKTPGGSQITDAKGVYFEFKVTKNYANSGAGSICLTITNSISNIYFGFYPATSDVYIRYTNGDSTYLNLELKQQYLNTDYHRMFVHFNNINGVATLGFDDKIYSIQNTPRGFISSSVSLSLLSSGHPGIMIDNMKVFKDQVFQIDDYMLEYYPEFKMAYPENNYDFTYSPVIHADQMTYNMTKPVFDFFNNYGISVSQTYFYNYSVSNAYDSETLANDEALRNYVIEKQDVNGIYTHAMKMNTNLKTSQIATILDGWKNLMGSYPLLWVDHGGMKQNIARYGSDSASEYYIGGLRNDSSLKYAWANYENIPRIPIPYGYYYSARNSLKGFLTDSNYGLVYNNDGATDLFTSGQRIFHLGSSTVKYDYFTWELANSRALSLEHTYQQYYLYKNIDGIKYTKLSPPAGYTKWYSSWNLHYKDATSPWMVLPEYKTVMDSIQNRFTVNSGLGHLLIDRGVVYNGSSVYKNGNMIYVDTPSEMRNITIYTRTNQTGKALERNGEHYPFTKGFYSWGATIPLNNGNNSFNLVSWSHKISDTGQIGRLVYNENGDVDIHFKRTGQVSLWVENPSVSIKNLSNGQEIPYTVSNNDITFNGKAGCQYLITSLSGGSEYVELDLDSIPESLRLLIIQEFIRQFGSGDYTISKISGLKQ